MDTTHTPGRWIDRSWNAHGSIDIHAPAHQRATEPRQVLARVYPPTKELSDDGIGYDTAELDRAAANARLIAEAPALLHELERVCDCAITVLKEMRTEVDFVLITEGNLLAAVEDGHRVIRDAKGPA